MFSWPFPSKSVTIACLQADVDQLLDENAELSRVLNAQVKYTLELEDTCAEAQRQSDEFEKIAREACDELEALKRGAAKPVAKSKKVAM